MTRREEYLLDCVQLCDLYTRDGGVTYRSIGTDAAEIFAIVGQEGIVKLQANVYPYHMTVQPFTAAGLERCKAFVRKWV